MGTKNNPKNRAKNIEKKKFNGKEVEPVLYNGSHVGHGKYIAVNVKYILSESNNKNIKNQNVFL